MKHTVAIFLFLLLFQFPSFSQRTNLLHTKADKGVTDSLKALLPETKDLKQKALLYKDLCWNYKNTNLDSTDFYAEKGIKIARQIKEFKIVADITRFRGIATWNFMHHNKAIDLYNEALAISKQINDQEGIGFSYDRIGVTYFYKKQYNQAQSYFEKARNIFLELNHKEGLGYAYSHLNWTATSRKEFERALAYGNEALRVRKAMNDKVGISNSLSDLGLVYKEMGKYDSAHFYLQKALDVSMEINLPQNIAEQGQYLADVYMLERKPNEAFQYATLAYNVASSTSNPLQLSAAAKMLTAILEQKQDYKNALYYKGIYHAIKDSLYNDEVRRNAMQQEFEYDFEKQRNKILQRENKEKLLLASIIITISIVTVFSIIGRRRKQKDNLLLKKKNEEIQKQKMVLEQQALELEQSNKMKNKLFSIISHDLKTPFANTSMLLKLLNDGIVSEGEFKEMLPRVNEQLVKSSELLESLLLWAKSQMDGKNVNFERFNLFVVVENHLEFYKLTAHNKGIELTNNINPTIFAYADKAMIEIVLRNLLSNALKFCGFGDIVKLGAFEADGLITVRVEDSGVGMSKDKVASLFKGHVTTTKGTANETGTGLGLMLCKDLIEKNNGNIWAESIEGEGSIFFFTIPSFVNQSRKSENRMSSAN